MAVPESRVMHILQRSFPRAKIIINDIAGDQNHYALQITCESFKGLSILDQHRAVKDSLADLLKKDLHALTIKVKTG